MGYDWLVVGAGFAGSVLAERLAARRGRRILVVDRRDHIGGNAFDEPDSSGHGPPCEQTFGSGGREHHSGQHQGRPPSP